MWRLREQPHFKLGIDYHNISPSLQTSQVDFSSDQFNETITSIGWATLPRVIQNEQAVQVVCTTVLQ